MRTFAADLGIVPSITIKHLRDMKKRCVFRIGLGGSIWRVVEYTQKNENGAYLYRIVHNRRVISRNYRLCAQLAIEECLAYALGCKVDIHWGYLL